MNITTVHEQWKSRPDDQRYLSLQDLRSAVGHRKTLAREPRISLGQVGFVAEEGAVLLTDGKTLSAPMTHLAFGQLAARLSLPASTLRDMPPELAALNLQWSLERERFSGEGPNAKLLVGSVVLPKEEFVNDYPTTPCVRAVTSETYGRIWDHEVLDALMRHIGPEWKVPSASYAANDPKKATTLYASDRDMFVFLVNETNPIEVPGTGGRERLHRGFFVSNSECGVSSLWLCFFFYRFVCDNRIIWGAEEVRELRIRHTAGGPGRFVREAQPHLRGYLTAGTGPAARTIQKALTHEVGRNKQEVVAFLRGQDFGKQVAEAAYVAAEVDGLNPRSLWGVVQGLTSGAHQLVHADARVERELAAGKLLDILK